MKVVPILLVSAILLSSAYFVVANKEANLPAIDIDSIANSILGNTSIAVIFENRSIATEIGQQLVGKVKSVDFYGTRDVDRALGKYGILFLAPEAVDRVSMNKSLVFKLIRSNTTIVLLNRDPLSLFRVFNSSEVPVTLIPIPINFTSNGEQVKPRMAATIIEVYAHRNITRYLVSYKVFGEGYSKRYIDILREWAKSRLNTNNQHRCGTCVKAQETCQYTCIAKFEYYESINDINDRGRTVGYQKYVVTFAYVDMASGQLLWRAIINHHVYSIDSSYVLPIANAPIFGWIPEPNRITVDVSKNVQELCDVFAPGVYVCGVLLTNRNNQKITWFEPRTATTYYSASGCVASALVLTLQVHLQVYRLPHQVVSI